MNTQTRDSDFMCLKRVGDCYVEMMDEYTGRIDDSLKEAFRERIGRDLNLMKLRHGNCSAASLLSSAVRATKATFYRSMR